MGTEWMGEVEDRADEGCLYEMSPTCLDYSPDLGGI